MQVGQVKKKVWGTIVVFPVQSLHAQDTWVRIQAVIKYAKVKVSKGGMAQGTPNQHP